MEEDAQPLRNSKGLDFEWIGACLLLVCEMQGPLQLVVVLWRARTPLLCAGKLVMDLVITSENRHGDRA